MPYRTLDMLQRWVDEFCAQAGRPELFKVIPQEGLDGADTGLIVVPIHGETTTAYLEPDPERTARWRIQFEPRTRQAVMSAEDVRAMAVQLHLAAELCDFIEQKSQAHLASLA